MIGFDSVFMTQIFLLCLMAVGAITAKARIVDVHSRLSLTELALSVFLPCNILSSFFGTDRSQLFSLGIILVISLGIMALSLLLSLMLYMRVAPNQKKILLYATLISNAALLGNPVVENIYGLEGLPYVAVYLLPIRVAIFTAGTAIFSGKKGSFKQLVFHPCLVATYLGLVIMITNFTPPALVSRLAFSLGNCTTPLSMVVVGNILAMVDPKKLLTRLTVYFTFIRLILIPLLVMGVLLLFRPDPMVAGISVILSGMPGAATTSILADKYGGDRELASKIVFVSTLLSIISAPLLTWLLEQAL